MSWRIVIVSSRAKLDYRMDYLVVRGEEEKRVHISEIGTLIIESTAVSMTAALLGQLSDRNITVVFCDNKRNPSCQLLPLYGVYNASKCLRNQITWTDERKTNVWTQIVRDKIYQQYCFLKELDLPESELLNSYVNELCEGDATNREGHAAKVYFNALYGKAFKRGRDDSVNSALNYGYSIILSAFNREIVAEGYLTQIGIFHSSEQNFFNLTCDFMEPYRIIIDRVVYANVERPFDKDYKRILVEALNEKVTIDGKKQYITNAIKIYVSSVFDALCGERKSILTYEF